MLSAQLYADSCNLLTWQERTSGFSLYMYTCLLTNISYFLFYKEKNLLKLSSIFLLLAEDPSENFVRLRDFVLAKLCQNLPSFSPEKLLEGFSQEMVTEAQQKLKINKVALAAMTSSTRYRSLHWHAGDSDKFLRSKHVFSFSLPRTLHALFHMIICISWELSLSMKFQQ